MQVYSGEHYANVEKSKKVVLKNSKISQKNMEKIVKNIKKN